MKLKRIAAAVLALTLLCTSAASASSVITKQFEFQTSNPDYASYTAEDIGSGDLKDIPATVENGFFSLKRVTDIKVKLLSEEVPEKAVFQDLLKKELPQKAKTYKTEDGKVLKLVDTEWEKSERGAASGTYTMKGYDRQPEFPKTKEITATLANGKTITTTGKLTSVRASGQSYAKDFSVVAKFVGDADVDYYILDGTRIPNDPASPRFSGYESVILKHLGLNPESYRITSGEWAGDYRKENGKTVRYAKFSGQKKAGDWTATYQETLTQNSPNRFLYQATCYYGIKKEAVYHVQVTAEYGKTEIIVGRVVAASVAVLVLAGLITFFLLLMARKRGPKEAEKKNS